MKRILIIDDDAGVREAFVAALSTRDFAVTAVGSGAAGVESAERQAPDLVFLDLKMPLMTGTETLLRLHAICPAVPVYIVTGFYDEYLRPLKELRARGIAFNLARKPLTVAEIRAIADGVLRASFDTSPPHRH